MQTQIRTRFPRFDKRLAPGVLAAFVAASFSVQAQAPAPLPLKTIPIKVAGHALKVEVADSDASRSRGLMYREKMARDDGMLFIFPELAYHSMWMRNTYLPLSVAFVDGAGVILNILDMEPRTEDTHMAAGPARFAIETNKGWFAAKKIKAGDKVTGLPKVPN